MLSWNLRHLPPIAAAPYPRRMLMSRHVTPTQLHEFCIQAQSGNWEVLNNVANGKIDLGLTVGILTIMPPFILTKISKYPRQVFRLYLHTEGKGKAVLLQAWSGPEVSRKLRFPDFMTTAQDGGKVVSLTHWPLFTPRKYSWHSFLLEAESTPGP